MLRTPYYPVEVMPARAGRSARFGAGSVVHWCSAERLLPQSFRAPGYATKPGRSERCYGSP